MSNEASAAWAARRAVMEGAPMTMERMAAAFRVSAAALAKRASAEGWKVSGASQGLSRDERIARIRDRLLDKAERIESDDEDSAPNKAAVAEFSVAVRTLLKIFETTRDDDDAQERQMKSDAEIADILGRLDRKVVELAAYLAERLVSEDVHAEASANP